MIKKISQLIIFVQNKQEKSLAGFKKYILAVSLERTNLDTAINIMKEILYQSSNDDYIEKALFFLITKSNIKEAEEYLSKLKNLYPESSYLTKSENNYYSRTVLKDDDFVLVKIDSINLYVMKNEVTQEQWKKIMNNNPSFFKGDSLPIENVSWDDVHEYINKLNRFNVDMIYRLPSEQEWDYFCVANTKTSYFFGDDPAYLINYGWFYDNSSKGIIIVLSK